MPTQSSLFGTPAQQPSIPPPTSGNLVSVAQNLKELVEIWQGARGDGLDRVLTVRDLLNTQVLDPDTATVVYTGNGQVVPPSIPTTPAEPAIPPTPDNLVAIGGVGTIVLSWDFPFEYTRLAYFEVWRADVDALGSASLVAKPYASVYADDVDVADTWYYWVRAVSDAGVSPFNAVAGTLGETAPAFEDIPAGTSGGEAYGAGVYLRDLYVRNGSIVEAKIGNAEITTAKIRDLAVQTAKIDDLAVTDAKIDDLAVTSAKIADLAVTNAKIADATITGAKIANATITNANIANATITAAEIADATITGAKIANATITSAKITGTLSSDDWTGAGGAGWAIVKSGGAGNAYFNNVYARGDIQASSLTANSVYASNIVGAQLSTVVSNTGSAPSVTVTINSGDRGIAIIADSGFGELVVDTQTYFAPNNVSVALNSSTLFSGKACTTYSISDPSPGTYTFDLTRGAQASYTVTGNATLTVIVTRR